MWSRGRRRERRDLVLTKVARVASSTGLSDLAFNVVAGSSEVDLRPMYMSFEFNCRTTDNVELVLEGSFFWEIVDLKAMMRFTSDTSGARRCLSQLGCTRDVRS
eukprot:1743816-Rhodomonas_salina.3